MEKANLDALIGQNVLSALIEEMALYGRDDAPVFDDHRLPFVQSQLLDLSLSDGRTLRFLPVQNDIAWSIFALWSKSEDALQPITESSVAIYRVRPMVEFPVGLVEEVDHVAGGDGYESVKLTIGGKIVLLYSGEVCENLDGSVTIHKHDESVLIFVDTEAFKRVVFEKPVFLD